MEQEAGYPISYSTDGVNFTDYVNDPDIVLAETGMAEIKFNTVENGTLIIRRTEPVPGAEPAVQPTPPDQPGPVETVQPVQPPASTAAATPTNDALWVDGQLRNATVYKIDGSSYFKLRDLGNALGFAVDYEAGKGMIINTAATAAAHEHNWTTRHVAEVGHNELSGGYQAIVFGCACGFTVDATDDDHLNKWIQHQKTCAKDDEDYTTWYIDVPVSLRYVVDTPAHDEAYCTICGAVQ